MNKLRKLIIPVMAIAALMAGGCKSHKQKAEAVQAAELIEAEPVGWRNVYAPVSVDIIQPAQFSSSGRMTMVRGESIYLSLRMFGMEVGSVYADGDRAVMAMRMPKKMLMELPVMDLFICGGMTLTDVQEALLGNPEALAKLPSAVSYDSDVTDDEAVVEFHATYAGKPLGIRFTWNLRRAEWDSASPRKWSEPGSDYTKVTPAQALRMLGGIL